MRPLPLIQLEYLMRLEGKVTLVTGAASGIGEACATLFAEEGAKIVAADVSEDGAVRTAAIVTQAGGEALAITGDVTQKTECERMVAETVEKFGDDASASAARGDSQRTSAWKRPCLRWSRGTADRSKVRP